MMAVGSTARVPPENTTSTAHVTASHGPPDLAHKPGFSAFSSAFSPRGLASPKANRGRICRPIANPASVICRVGEMVVCFAWPSLRMGLASHKILWRQMLGNEWPILSRIVAIPQGHLCGVEFAVHGGGSLRSGSGVDVDRSAGGLRPIRSARRDRPGKPGPHPDPLLGGEGTGCPSARAIPPDPAPLTPGN